MAGLSSSHVPYILSRLNKSVSANTEEGGTTEGMYVCSSMYVGGGGQLSTTQSLHSMDMYVHKVAIT